MARKTLEDLKSHGSWKIALADLMTVLMVFFLVMWLISILEPSQRQQFVESVLGQTSEATISVIESDNTVDSEAVIALESMPPATMDVIQQALQEVPIQDIDFSETETHFIVTLHSDSFFESARAIVNDLARAQLEKLAERLVSTQQNIVITGHTDDVPISNFQFPSNWELSAARAGTVARIFQDMEVGSDRLTIVGKAYTVPIVSNESAYGRSRNRRVVIEIEKL